VELFAGAKLKIERAYKHIADFNALWEQFIRSEFCRLSIEVDSNTRDNILKLESVKPLPPDAALIVGDAIRNLHAALDLMICEVVPSPNRQTKFPFSEKRKELPGQIKNGKIETAGADICDLIINTIKPCRGGNDALYGLHDLDILGKHIRLILLIGVVALNNIDMEDDNGNIFTGCGGLVQAGGRVDSITNDAKMQIKNYGDPTFEITFDNGPFQREPVVPTLHQLAQLVSGVVQTIEKTYIVKVGAGL